MDQLNINRNTFLEKEEVMNMQSYLQNSPVWRLIIAGTYSFGIITNNPTKYAPNYIPNIPGFKADNPFYVEPGTGIGTIKVLPGMAINSLGQLISINQIEDNISIAADGNFYWVKIGFSQKNYENGLVSVNQKGNVTGTVDFTGKVRGQSGKTPVCIRFTKSDGSQAVNNGIYEIVQTIDSKNLILTSNVEFVPETNLRVFILGTLPLGGVFNAAQLRGLYTYDTYTISLIRESELETPPIKSVNEFYIARVVNNGGVVTTDNSIKSEFWSLANAFIGLSSGGEGSSNLVTLSKSEYLQLKNTGKLNSNIHYLTYEDEL